MSSYISSPVYLTGGHFSDTDGNSVASSDLYSVTSHTATSHTATESELNGRSDYNNLSELYSGGDMFAPLFSNLFSASSPLETVVESPPYLETSSAAGSPVQPESMSFQEDHFSYENFTDPSLFFDVSGSTQSVADQLGHVSSNRNFHVQGAPMDAERQHYRKMLSVFSKFNID